MRNFFKKAALLLCASMMLVSCYSYQFSVGEGSQTGTEVKGKNHYLIYGLAPLSTEDPKEMAGGAENYDVKIVHSFIDGLINSITFGIYNPVTVIVTK
jgi:hypothetical protein